MTTQKNANGNPFLDFDVTKLMAEFDPTKFAGEFAKLADKYKMPGLNVDAAMETHRRNVEALTAANRTAAEGVRTLAKRQSEILEQTLGAARDAFAKLGKAGTPEAAAAQQAAIAKDVFEKAVSNTQALTEIVAKSNAKTADVITGRIAEGLNEIKALADKLNG